MNWPMREVFPLPICPITRILYMGWTVVMVAGALDSSAPSKSPRRLVVEPVELILVLRDSTTSPTAVFLLLLTSPPSASLTGNGDGVFGWLDSTLPGVRWLSRLRQKSSHKHPPLYDESDPPLLLG